MAIKTGDEVQAKRELSGGFLGVDHVSKGKKGVVFKVSAWSGKYSVRFEDGTKCDDLTDDDIEPKKGFFGF